MSQLAERGGEVRGMRFVDQRQVAGIGRPLDEVLRRVEQPVGLVHRAFPAPLYLDRPDPRRARDAAGSIGSDFSFAAARRHIGRVTTSTAIPVGERRVDRVSSSHRLLATSPRSRPDTWIS
jgi:hypothetical protein